MDVIDGCSHFWKVSLVTTCARREWSRETKRVTAAAGRGGAGGGRHGPGPSETLRSWRCVRPVDAPAGFADGSEVGGGGEGMGDARAGGHVIGNEGERVWGGKVGDGGSRV